MKESEMIKVANAITREEEKIMRIESEIERFKRAKQVKILKQKYDVIDVYGKVAIVSDSHRRKQGVVSLDGTIIVPCDKYGWIDEFDSGFARVRTHGKVGYCSSKNTLFSSSPDAHDRINRHLFEDSIENPDKYVKWGIINEAGEEVLPLKYDEIWGWVGKCRSNTTVRIGHNTSKISFSSLKSKM